MAPKGDQGVAVKTDKSAARARSHRLATRLRRLQWISQDRRPGEDQISKALRALAQVREQGGRDLARVEVRASFVTRRKDLEGEVSDRRRRKDQGPPVVDVAAPRGIALQLELVALFVAQAQKSRRGDGQVVFDLPLEPADAGALGWIDLVVPHAEHSEAAVYAANLRDNRLRQVKRALDSLAAKDLVDLPNGGKTRGKHEGFRLLDEGGPRPTGPPLLYRVPAPAREAVITIPVEFFSQGWVYVLTDSEIALYLMLRHRAGATTDGQVEPVFVSGEVRRRRYGVSKDAYKGWWLHDLAGLIDVVVDPNRRSDGTVAGFTTDDPSLFHRFLLTDDGLSKPAAPATKIALDAALRGEPVGVARAQAAAGGLDFWSAGP